MIRLKTHFSQGTKACQEVGNIAGPQCSGLHQLHLELPSHRVKDPANNQVELCGDLWMRVFAHLPALDLLSGCCAVCRQWRDWVHELTASKLTYRQDFTCRCCDHQVSCSVTSSREEPSGNAEGPCRHVWIAMQWAWPCRVQFRRLRVFCVAIMCCGQLQATAS